MATINLGAIKFNWKGAYNSSTTYAVDDVVSSGGNSYVCIQAHSNQAVGNATAYWNIMSAKGTNGTDGTDADLLSIGSTTGGDIYYNSGSAIARLPKGTAGQVLQMNSGATAPEYATASGGKILQIKLNTPSTTQYSTSSSSYVDAGADYTIVITPTSATSRMLIYIQFANQTSGNRTYYDIEKGGDAGGTLHLSSVIANADSIANNENVGADGNGFQSMQWIDDINSTNQLTYKLRHKNGGGISSHIGVAGSANFMYIMELAGDLF